MATPNFSKSHRSRNNPMTTYNSKCTPGPVVTFPEWRGERHYMLPFTLAKGLPAEVSRYEQTVQQMMLAVAVSPDQVCYLMVDEAEISPDKFHRRPGLHVDGYWHAGLQCHGGGGGSHGPKPNPGHRPSPPTHAPTPPGHSPAGNCSEVLLLASNYGSARALLGTYQRNFLDDWRGGNCSEIPQSGLTEIRLEGGRVYNMDVFSLHESLPVTQHVRRSLVRINIPNAVSVQ